jgi:hypothetical protein
MPEKPRALCAWGKDSGLPLTLPSGYGDSRCVWDPPDIERMPERGRELHALQDATDATPTVVTGVGCMASGLGGHEAVDGVHAHGPLLQYQTRRRCYPLVA